MLLFEGAEAAYWCGTVRDEYYVAGEEVMARKGHSWLRMVI